jgi:hypothetical protein
MMYQLLVKADVNLLGQNINIKTRNTVVLTDARKEAGLQVDGENWVTVHVLSITMQVKLITQR